MKHIFGRPSAVAKISGNTPDAPSGIVYFYKRKNGTLIVANIVRLPDSGNTCASGFFGFHIHHGTTCRDDFAQTHGHLDLADCMHPYHAGDLPPLLSCNGKAFMAVLSDRFRITDIIGRTVVIHRDPDDFRTEPAGNSGEKIACGVITAL